MMKMFALALAASAAVVVAAPADARDGCGRGMHRGYQGRCRPDRGRQVMVAPGSLIVGNYYGRRGYWDGNRYWQHRYRSNNAWRYR